MGPLARRKDPDRALSVLLVPTDSTPAPTRCSFPKQLKRLEDYRVGVLLDTTACVTSAALESIYKTQLMRLLVEA